MISTANPVKLRRYWQILSLFQITVLIHVMVYMLSPDQGQSVQFRLLAVGWFVLALLVFVVTLNLNRLVVSNLLTFTG